MSIKNFWFNVCSFVKVKIWNETRTWTSSYFCTIRIHLVLYIILTKNFRGKYQTLQVQCIWQAWSFFGRLQCGKAIQCFPFRCRRIERWRSRDPFEWRRKSWKKEPFEIEWIDVCSACSSLIEFLSLFFCARQSWYSLSAHYVIHR